MYFFSSVLLLFFLYLSARARALAYVYDAFCTYSRGGNLSLSLSLSKKKERKKERIRTEREKIKDKHTRAKERERERETSFLTRAHVRILSYLSYLSHLCLSDSPQKNKKKNKKKKEIKQWCDDDDRGLSLSRQTARLSFFLSLFLFFLSSFYRCLEGEKRTLGYLRARGRIEFLSKRGSLHFFQFLITTYDVVLMRF